MENRPCPVCKLESAEVGLGSVVAVHCATCGRFTMPRMNTVEQTATQLRAPTRAYLAQYVRQRYEDAAAVDGPEAYAVVEWGEAFQWARKQPVRGELTRDAISNSAAADVERALVAYLLKKRARAYSTTVLRSTDYALLGTDSQEAVEALLRHAESRGLIARLPLPTEARAWHVALTGTGEALATSGEP